MKLSIITVCYNAQLTIPRTLDSISNVLNMKNSGKIEHIIVDGGSQDGTLDTVENYAKKNKNVKLISGKDKGIYDAYNKGLFIADGDFVWFVNADDIIRDDAVDIILQKINEFPENMLFCFSISRVNDKGNSVVSIRNTKEPIKILSPICHTPGIIWNNQLLRNTGGFDLDFKICSDFKTLQTILPYTKIKGFEDVVIDMYLGGVSSQYKFEILKAKEQLRIIFCSIFSKPDKIKASSRIFVKLFRNLFVNPLWRIIKQK